MPYPGRSRQRMASNRRALTGQRLTFITTKPESVRALPASKRTGAFLYQRIIEGHAPDRRVALHILRTPPVATFSLSLALRLPGASVKWSKLEWSDRNSYLAIRRLLDSEINFL